MPNFSGVWTLQEQYEARVADVWDRGPVTQELYAWGKNDEGQLGKNDTANSSSPIQIGALINWSQVSAGENISSAIKTDGTLWTWGLGSSGRLGNSATVSVSSPVQVGGLTDWYQVSVGYVHAGAVKTDGSLWTWGDALNGRLGLNGPDVDESSPVQVGALTNWSQFSAGNNFSAAVKTDGTLWAWGRNNSGTVGDGTRINRSSPVQIGSLTNWSQVSVNQSVCAAVKTDAWGRNNTGKLGDNTIISRSSPVQVGALTNWSQVSSGNSHSAAVKTDKTVWTWGDNSPYGNLGDGTVVDRSSPVQVGALSIWSEVSAGSGQTLANTYVE